MHIHPLPQGFGADISGFDLRNGRAAGDIAQLQRAYAEHHLLVFRSGERLEPERQVEIAGWFGPVGANSDAQGRPWSVLSNDEEAGSRILPFHCDISFFPEPIEGLCLHPLELPVHDTSTSFVSNAIGWDGLSPEVQAVVRNRKARHYFADATVMGLDMPVLEHWHPVCLHHRETGRPLLFVTEHHVDRIEDMAEVESRAILQEMFAALYAPERRYEHVWRPGDLVIWDNLAVQHARTRVAPHARGMRALRRVALGRARFRDQLEQVRREAATGPDARAL